LGNARNIKVPEEVQEVFIDQREELFNLLPQVLPINAGVRDAPTWAYSHKRSFSVKSAYRVFNDGVSVVL